MKRATGINAKGDIIKGISIHALMKRATQGVKQQILYYGISIHALVKRATDRAIAPQVIIRHFNPRPREEGDRILR